MPDDVGYEGQIGSITTDLAPDEGDDEGYVSEGHRRASDLHVLLSKVLEILDDDGPEPDNDADKEAGRYLREEVRPHVETLHGLVMDFLGGCEAEAKAFVAAVRKHYEDEDRAFQTIARRIDALGR